MEPPMEPPPTVWLPDSKWVRANDPVVLDWERVRSQIQHEDTLINWRITWAIQINAMLLTAFAAGVYFISDPAKGTRLATQELLSWLLVVFAVFGALVSVITFRSVKMANSQISKLVEWWKRRIASEMDRHPPLVGESHAFIDRWLRYGYVMPIAFTTLWLALGVAYFHRAVMTVASQTTRDFIYLAIIVVLILFVFLRSFRSRDQGHPA